MNFILEWQKRYLTNEHSEGKRYCFCHENIKFISSSQRVMFFFLLQYYRIESKAQNSNRSYVKSCSSTARISWISLFIFYFIRSSLSSSRLHEVFFFALAYRLLISHVLNEQRTEYEYFKSIELRKEARHLKEHPKINRFIKFESYWCKRKGMIHF